MGIVDYALVHYDRETKTHTNLSELFSADSSIEMSATAGTCGIKLHWISYYDEDFFVPGDSIEIYAKNGVLNTSSLADMSINNPDDILDTIIVEEVTMRRRENQLEVSLKGKNKTKLLNDFLVSQDFTGAGYRVAVDGGNSDNSIVHWIVNTINSDETAIDSGLGIEIGTVETTSENSIDYSTNFKSASEVLSELLTETYTDGAGFTFWLDNLNKLHIRQRTLYGFVGSSVESGIVYPGRGDAIQATYNNRVESPYNYIIFDAGEDYNGNSIIWYYTDVPNASRMGFKRTFKSYTGIAKDLINSEVYLGDNPGLRTEAIKRGLNEAARNIKGLSGARWFNKPIEVRGTNSYAIGNVYKFQETKLGWNEASDSFKLLRVDRITHNIGKDGWFTQLNAKEDDLLKVTA